MKISLILTVLNEEKSILGFLQSVAEQTKIPNEVVIVDGGSLDKTVQLIKEYKEQHSELKIQSIEASGCNRSHGRNIAIYKAKHSIIAATDAGCVLHPNWLENITQPFKNKNIALVGGTYQPVTQTLWHRAAAQSASVNFNQINPATFLPSSRSIAFRKSAWKKVGGYPERLNTAEDLVFAQRLHHAGFKQTLAKDAVVDWNFPSSTIKIIKQFYHYAYGDGLSGFESHHSKRYLIKTTYILALLMSIFSFTLFGSMLSLLSIWMILKSLKACFQDPLFHQSGFIRGFYFWCNLGWAVILFPVTLLGFWVGVLRSIIINVTRTQEH